MQLFRYDDGWNEDSPPFLHTFEVVRETEKSYYIKMWITDPDGKWVLKGDGKRFAHDTVEKARYSFIRRKERQIILASNTLRRAQAQLNHINGIKEEEFLP